MNPLPNFRPQQSPDVPSADDTPLFDRRALLRRGGALSVTLAVGGGLDMILRTMASPATAGPPTTGTGDLRVLSSLTKDTNPPAVTAVTIPPATTTTTTEMTAPHATTAQAPPGSVESAAVAPTKFFGPPTGHHVYITIDDGYFPDNRVIDVIRSEHVPITTFLIAEAAAEHLSFWKSFVTAGGQIQNHTYSHPDLTSLSKGDAEGQWARTNKLYKGWFGQAPVLGRPPYGALNHRVAVAAREAGLSSIIMWSALDDGAGIQTWNNKPIAPGSIILLHWMPGLYDSLVAVLRAVADNHLVPAFLTATGAGLPVDQASTTARRWSARLSASGPASVATTMSSRRMPQRPGR